MTTVVHETPGLIDIRALTVLGVNAKPGTSSPIGYFGTGLKYAVAVLCRLRAKVTVWIGTEPYEFYTRDAVFRGKEFQQLYLRRQRGVTRRWFAEQLPFTTEFGKGWEVWQALRELHSNTLDEGGVSYAVHAGGTVPDVYGSPTYEWIGLDGSDRVTGLADHTRIVVSLPAYAEAFSRLHETFLARADQSAALAGVQSLPGECRYLYYRGLRAKDLVKPALRTWVFWSQLTLTEDRTLKEDFYAKWYAACHVRQSSDRGMIREVVSALEGCWERDLDFVNTASSAPASPEFTEIAQRYGRRELRDYAAYHAGADSIVTLPWQREVILACQGEPEELGRVAWAHKTELIALLERDQRESEESDRAPEVILVPRDAEGYDLPF